jgi:hypothetical protein
LAKPPGQHGDHPPAGDDPEGLGLVRGWVEAKLNRQLEFLEEQAVRRPSAAADFDSARTGIRDYLDRLSGLAGALDRCHATVTALERAAPPTGPASRKPASCSRRAAATSPGP